MVIHRKAWIRSDALTFISAACFDLKNLWRSLSLKARPKLTEDWEEVTCTRCTALRSIVEARLRG